jgi:ABC-type phosphate transport system permease subunit
MATPVVESRTATLASIRIPENVRELDHTDVDALARLLALQGMLVPVVVRTGGEGLELVPGFTARLRHRSSALRISRWWFEMSRPRMAIVRSRTSRGSS